jgi:hypothetical protein
VNSGAIRADTPNVRNAPPTDSSYFVRLGGDPQGGAGPIGHTPIGREGLGSSGPPRRRRRRRGLNGKRVLLVLLIVGAGTWAYWASQRPGGISGTVSSWVHTVRGDVARVSADPDLAQARRYFNGQYAASGSYPQLGESDLAAVGIGVGVNVDNCSTQAVVIQGASGGGTTSRLLLSGHDLGEVQGKYDCPADLAHPLPWKIARHK